MDCVLGTVTGVEEAAVRALAKLERVLPQRLRLRVQAMQRAVFPLYPAPTQVHAGLLTALASACRDHLQASFRYADRVRTASERTVEPHGLVHTGARWYLVAWDVDRAAWRTFRVDRIEDPVESGWRFVPRSVPGGDLAAFVSRSVVSNPYRVKARVRIHAPLARVAERVPPLAGHLVRIDEACCMLESGAHSLAVLAYHLAMIGEEFEVEEPAELADCASAIGVRLTRAAARSAHRRR